MKSKRLIAIAGLLGLACSLSADRLRAQSCQDERGMADIMVKQVADEVGTVKKESQADFDGKFHQKTSLSKLTLTIGAVNELVDCLGKDPAAAADKDSESKLKDRLAGYKSSLKGAPDSKAAKQLIATFDIPAPAPAPATASK